MMKATGIVVEYNPFHNGHIYHINKTREITNCDCLVAVMSGNFVQRGEFAVIDKWKRTKAALENGVDLVLELPFCFATQAANNFASHSIDILAQAKVDSVVFGSEINNIEELTEIANLPFKIDNFKENMKKGFSYPASYGFMADNYGPNDILAISYLRALNKYPEIKPYCIKRESDYLNDELDEKYPSGLAIRTALQNGKDISNQTVMEKELSDYPIVTWQKAYPYIRQIILSRSPEELHKIFLIDEGIENLLYKKAYSCFNYEDFINECTTRRYTRSRIQRTLCQLLVNNTKEDMANLPEYDTIRVLGYNDVGKQYLKELKAQEVKIANHFTANIKQYRDIEYRAAVAYGMLMDEKHQKYINQAEIAGLNL